MREWVRVCLCARKVENELGWQQPKDNCHDCRLANKSVLFGGKRSGNESESENETEKNKNAEKDAVTKFSIDFFGFERLTKTICVQI